MAVDSNCKMSTMGTENNISAWFSTCLGKQTCILNLTSNLFSSSCQKTYPDAYIFLTAVCASTQVSFNLWLSNVKIDKSSIAITAVICDCASILIFAVGVALYPIFK